MDKKRPPLEPPPNLERLHASRAANATPAPASSSQPIDRSHAEQSTAAHEAHSSTAHQACLGHMDRMDVDERTPHVTASPTRPPSPVEDGQSWTRKPPPKDFVQLDAVTASGIEQAIRKMHRAYAALRVETDVQKRERAYTIFVQGEGQRHCLNKGGEHKHSTIYFTITPKGISQKCHCGRGTGAR